MVARKQRTETIAATFEAINKLALYPSPFSIEALNNKLADLKSVAAELETYMKSLENVDSDVAAAIEQNNVSDQIKKRSDALSAESLHDNLAATNMAKIYMNLRQTMAPVNALGLNRYAAMYTDFT